jgi:hypothetical protein
MNTENIQYNLNAQFPKNHPNIHLVEEFNGQISINGLCFLPIKVPHHFDSSISTKIYDELGIELGEILYLQKESSIEVTGLTELHYSCLLIEIDTEEITESNYVFKYDYLLINNEKLNRYLTDYKAKSPIWGGFFHIEEMPNNKFTKTISLPVIIANQNISLTNDNKEILEQVVLESNPFNRYLRLYHLLELLFDMHTAYIIKEMLDAGGKEKEISDTLRDYGKEDIERLKSLFKSKVDKINLEPYLNNILHHKQTAKNIFYYREKDSNPLRSINKFEKLFTKTSINQVNFDAVFGTNWYDDKILATVAYWIYRVRNCIAHNKLGEYVIGKDDEDFVIEFAEPLIREIVKQCYRR